MEVHARRFSVFSAIGVFVFVMGLTLQVLLTGQWHLPALASYLTQAVASVETSFLLNRWLTWRDRNIPFWNSLVRFNMQKTITIALNVVLYAGLLRAGVNYLAANVILTGVFTVVNYAAGDRLVFSPRRARSAAVAAAKPGVVPPPDIRLTGPVTSVVIPVRNNQATIGAAIRSLLSQDYANLAEIVVVGGPEDTTWNGLAGIGDPRLKLIECNAPPGLRDANFKRDLGIRMTKGDLIALVDSDVVLPGDWLSTAVTCLRESGVSCVAGDIKSIDDCFWGRYTDSTVIGAKTPRITESYLVTKENFGRSGRKPPITANTLFTRKLYDGCGLDPTWSHGSLEDYEWFWRVAKAGYSILVSSDLFGWHHHRRGMRALVKEYRRSARGCAYFIRAHFDCPFARRRLWQAVLLPIGALAGCGAAAGVGSAGESAVAAAVIAACLVLLAVQQIQRMRRVEAIAYPVVGLALGALYTAGLVNHLLRTRKVAGTGPAGGSGVQLPESRVAGAGAEGPHAAGAAEALRPDERCRPVSFVPLVAADSVGAQPDVAPAVWLKTAPR